MTRAVCKNIHKSEGASWSGCAREATAGVKVLTGARLIGIHILYLDLIPGTHRR